MRLYDIVDGTLPSICSVQSLMHANCFCFDCFLFLFSFIAQAFYYDGSVQCFAGQHLILAIPSLILFVVVVALGPAFVILISFKRYRVSFPAVICITIAIWYTCLLKYTYTVH